MKRKFELGLLVLRWFSFLVLLLWTVGIFVSDGEQVGVFARIYLDFGLSEQMLGILGSVQIVVLLAFVSGALKNLTYVLAFLLHLLVTFSFSSTLLDPWGEGNWIFFAALPMLGGLYVLYLLKDYDRLLSLDSAQSTTAAQTYPDK